MLFGVQAKYLQVTSVETHHVQAGSLFLSSQKLSDTLLTNEASVRVNYIRNRPRFLVICHWVGEPDEMPFLGRPPSRPNRKKMTCCVRWPLGRQPAVIPSSNSVIYFPHVKADIFRLVVASSSIGWRHLCRYL